MPPRARRFENQQSGKREGVGADDVNDRIWDGHFYLSGGMDAYVRAFGTNQLHDEFYTSDDIINFFQNYTQQVVSRFVDNPFVFGWELANDPRCGSTVANSDTCTTTTITKWHATVSEFIRSIDPNHLVASG